MRDTQEALSGALKEKTEAEETQTKLVAERIELQQKLQQKLAESQKRYGELEKKAEQLEARVAVKSEPETRRVKPTSATTDILAKKLEGAEEKYRKMADRVSDAMEEIVTQQRSYRALQKYLISERQKREESQDQVRRLKAQLRTGTARNSRANSVEVIVIDEPMKKEEA